MADRRISPGEVSQYLSEMHREIGDLERRLDSLRAAAGTGSQQQRPQPQAAVPARRGRPRKDDASRNASAANAARSTEAAKGTNATAGGTTGAGRRGRRQRTAITAEQLASRQLQGRYLALVRQIPQSKRAQYARIAKEKGRESAIQAMQEQLGK